jgi:undecaprenyl diphosphate synthase
MSTENTKDKNIPAHIAIIADGNRRWAKSRGLPEIMGHKKGGEVFESLVDYARSVGVKCMTLWVFSTENWKRPQNEIDNIFNLVRLQIDKYGKKCMNDKIRCVHIGRKDRFPEDIKQAIVDIEEKTKGFKDFTIAVAADYGGHDELIRAITKVNDQKLEITSENIEKNLDTADLPNCDLIIRPGGEKRFSGFMSWQSEYAEFYFTDLYFPDFDTNQLQVAIDDFSKRTRRFGGNSK